MSYIVILMSFTAISPSIGYANTHTQWLYLHSLSVSELLEYGRKSHLYY
jgi:hypothetical protein